MVVGRAPSAREEPCGRWRNTADSASRIRPLQHFPTGRRVFANREGRRKCGGCEQRVDGVHFGLDDPTRISELVYASVGCLGLALSRSKGELLLAMKGDCILWNLELKEDDPFFEV